MKSFFGKFISIQFILLCITIGASCFVFAAESNVELEWEPELNARKYDLEVKTPNKVFVFTTTRSTWNGRLTPGVFKMRVRGRDKRNVPGPWSSYQEFNVYLDPVEIKYPLNNSIINSNSDESEKLKLNWQTTPFAKKYKIEIASIDGKFKKEDEVTKNSYTLDLPVANEYTVKVVAANDIVMSHPDKQIINKFVIVGKKLDPPELNPVDSIYVRELSWSKPDFSDAFQYKIEKYDVKKKSFIDFIENKNYKSNILPFKQEWPGGLYRIKVSALGEKRLDSQFVSQKFSVIDGNRSVVTEELATLRESIDRLKGWFVTGSYMITAVDYQNNNRDVVGSTTTYSAIGGSGRLGIGFMTQSKAWGFYSAMEISTLDVERFSLIKYSTLELNSIYKIRPNDYGEFRQTIGVIYKEIPDVGENIQKTKRINSAISGLGVRYGVEYWQAITSKLGLQAHAQFLPTLYGVKTNNSQALNPTISYQAGLLASYRYNKNLTTLLGYAFRVDSGSYKSIPNSQTENLGSDSNEVLLQGHYLNFLLEYQL